MLTRRSENWCRRNWSRSAANPRRSFPTSRTIPISPRAMAAKSSSTRPASGWLRASFPWGSPPPCDTPAPGSNHHMEIVATVDVQGNETRWEALTVNLMDAAERVRNGKPVVKRDHGPGKTFKFSLAGGEYLELHEDGNRRLVRVTVISGKIVEFRLHTDARPITLLRETKGGRAGLSKPVDSLRKANARKVVVDPLGKILWAND